MRVPTRSLVRSCAILTAAFAGGEIRGQTSSNDSCSTPIALTGPGPYPVNNVGATTGAEGQGNSLCSFSSTTGIGNDVWFTWTATQTGTAIMAMCGTVAFDSKVAVYTGSGCPTGSAIACSDDSCGAQSELYFSATSGITYTIQIGNAPGSLPGTGSFTLRVIPSVGQHLIFDGPVQGTVNGDVIDAHLLIIGDKGTGRAFATLSNIPAAPAPPAPATIGSSWQVVITTGTLAGPAVGDPHLAAINGSTLFGGNYVRTSVVTYSTGEVLNIVYTASYPGTGNVVSVVGTVNGTIPELPAGAVVHYPGWEDHWFQKDNTHVVMNGPRPFSVNGGPMQSANHDVVNTYNGSVQLPFSQKRIASDVVAFYDQAASTVHFEETNDIYPLHEAPWTDLGSGHAGVSGVPQLVGVGTLVAGSSGTLTMAAAAPSSISLLLLSVSSTPVPFLCGTLVPFPFQFYISLFTNPSGGIPLLWPSWPAGLSGVTLYWQYAVLDPAASCSASLSNALRSDVP